MLAVVALVRAATLSSRPKRSAALPPRSRAITSWSLPRDSSNSIASAVGRYSPGVFAAAQSDGTPVVIKPAKAGDVIVIFANGLGPVNNQPASGAVSPADPLAPVQQNPTVTIGGQPAQVLFAGLAPGFVGAYQVNVRVPSGLPAGLAPLVISAGGQTAPAWLPSKLLNKLPNKGGRRYE